MKTKIGLLSLLVAFLAFFTSCSKKSYYAFSYSPNGTAYHSHEKTQTESISEDLSSVNVPTVSEVQGEDLEKQIDELVKVMKQKPEVVVAKESPEVVSSKEVKSVTKKERKAIKKNLRAKLKELKSSSKTSNSTGLDPIVLAIISIIFPLAPLMMFFYEGGITTRFWISLILTLLGWLPGVIYNFLVMLEVI